MLAVWFPTNFGTFCTEAKKKKKKKHLKKKDSKNESIQNFPFAWNINFFLLIRLLILWVVH